MHGSSGAIWKFIILFSFLYIVLFSSEPDFIKDEDGNVSKMMISWWALIGSFAIALVMWILFYRSYYLKTQEMMLNRQK